MVRRFTLSFPGTGDDSALAARPLAQIVLVEDSPADVGLVREALLQHRVPCELIVIVNGERAVRFLDEIDAGVHHCPTLFIIDLNLPRKPGRAVLQRIGEGMCGAIPVIVLTSSDSQKDKDEVARIGSSQYIRKPSKLDDFLKLGAVFKQILYPNQ
jgi:DNA-binding response OmpR family regulator